MHRRTGRSDIVDHAHRLPDARNISNYWTGGTKEYSLRTIVRKQLKTVV